MFIGHLPAYQGKIIVQFEDHECIAMNDDGNPVWLDAVDEIKTKLPYPKAIYIHALDAWSVEDTPENLAILEDIRDRYFIDKDQLELKIPSSTKEGKHASS